MGAVAHEMCHAVVVELGRTLFRSVALAAIPTQLATVGIFLFVAVHALDLAELVASVDVTAFALGGLVLAFQRELLAVLPVETQVLEVLGRNVAFDAFIAKLSLVFVFVLVAVDTVDLVGAVDFVGVTVHTLRAHLGLGVETKQCEARILVVGEGPRARATFHVAASAGLVRKLSLVYAFVLVT